MSYYDTYYNNFQSFLLFIFQSDLLHQVSELMYSDFPNNMPNYIKRNIQSSASVINKSSRKNNTANINLSLNYNKDDILAMLLNLKLRLRLISNEVKTIPGNDLTEKDLVNFEDIEFSRIINYQYLVAIFTYFESFISDSVRSICNSNNKVMISEKKSLKWIDIINNDHNQILERMIDEYVIEFTAKANIREIINRLNGQRINEHNNSINIDVKIPIDEIRFIDEARKIRHIIVHNNGRADKKYIGENDIKNIKLGEQIDISNEYIADLVNKILLVSKTIFVAVASKYLGVDKAEADQAAVINITL